MLKLLALVISFVGANGYFTLPGPCPTNIRAQDAFKMDDFAGKWNQIFFYSSDGQRLNNCSVIELETKREKIFGFVYPMVLTNMSRVDYGVHKYSQARYAEPYNGFRKAILGLNFNYPRETFRPEYNFMIISTNYVNYATAYSCQYSSRINKHYVYIWILSRDFHLDEDSKRSAFEPLPSLGITPDKLVKQDWNKCSPKYYEDSPQEPAAFRFVDCQCS